MPTSWTPTKDRPFQIEQWLLMIVFLTLPLEAIGLLKHSHGSLAGGLTVAKIFILLGLAWWAVRTILSQDQYILRVLFGRSTSVFLLGSIFVAFSTLTIAPYRPYFTQFLIQGVSLYLLYLLIIGVIQAKPRVFKWCLAALLIGTVPSSLGGIYEALTGHLIMKGRIQTPLAPEALAKQKNLYKSESGRYRIASFSGDTGMHGVHWAVYAPLSLAVPFLVRRRWLKIVGWGFVMLTIVNCLGTGTRTGMGGMLVGVLLFFWFAKIRHKAQLAVVSVVAALALGAMLGAPLERILGKEHKAEVSTAWRIAMSKMAVKMIHDHPVMGVGVGNFVGLYYKYAEFVPEANRTPIVMHNGYLAVWAEQGTIGLIFFLSIFGSVTVILWRCMRHPANDYVHYASVGLAGALAAHLVTQFGYPLLGDELGYLVMGLAVALDEVNRSLNHEYPFRSTLPPAPAGAETPSLPLASG